MPMLSEPTITAPYCNLLISQQYRQSLQPYAEPEMLEVAYYQPQQQQVEEIKHRVPANKQGYWGRLFMVVVGFVCLSGVAYHHKAQLPTGLSFLQFNNLAVK